MVQDLQDGLGHKVALAQQVSQDPLEQQGLLVSRVSLVGLDHKDPRVLQEVLVLLDLMDVLEALVQLVHKVPRASRDGQVLKDSQEVLVQQEILVCREEQELLDHKAV